MKASLQNKTKPNSYTESFAVNTAGMKATMQRWDEWLRRRFRCYIWKQWKKPRKRAKSLIGHTGMAGVGSKQLPESLLAHGKEWSCAAGNLNRKTRTGRILQYP